jgi:flagellar motility protein MotE (MotC chaperone)
MTSFNGKRGPRLFRLLPGVVALGAVVLTLKTTDLVHGAYAQAGEHASATLTHDPVPSNKDFAGGEEDQVASASEVDVVNSLSKRRRELDARDALLNTQANMIAAAEARVDAKINQLKQLQAQINALVGQRDEAQKAQIASLVKTYTAMKAKDAARIFDNLPDEVLVPVAHDMKSDVLGSVMASMNAERARSLTVKLADRLTLPQTTTPDPAAAAAQAPAPVPAPGPQANAAPTPKAPAPAAPENQAKPKG